MEQKSTTILILSANPKGTAPLRLDEEKREIEAGLLERSRLRKQFQLVSKVAVRSRDFQRAMLDCFPQVVHFSGHGQGDTGLIIEDQMGQPKLLSTDALSALFELYADNLKCVLLNACYSTVQAEAIAQHIPYVIGMSNEIGDSAAIEFAIAFYDALGAGQDVPFAYKNACAAIKMAGVSGADIPVLHQRDYSPRHKTTLRQSSYSSRDTESKLIKLTNLLKAKQWKEADQETDSICSQDRVLRIENIGSIPCEDWLSIDQLWSMHSDGHFGLSCQRRIWIESKRNSEVFNRIVGWKKNGEWISYDGLLFSRRAPKGHLPTLWSSTKAFGGFRQCLFTRIGICYEAP